MKKLIIFSFLILAIPFVACHNKELAKSNKTTSSTSKTESSKNVIIDASIDVSTIEGAPTNVDSLTITGNVLSIFVNYSGGCKEHNFDLFSTDSYEKSLPPQLTLYIKHTNNGDECRELVMRELKFNIAAIKKNYSALRIKIGNQTVIYSSK